jgi:hypothetical protein
VHCWGDSCYYYFAAASYTAARAKCANMSAIVFSPYSIEEQLDVESYFRVMSRAASDHPAAKALDNCKPLLIRP